MPSPSPKKKLRTCIACRAMGEKASLVRIVRTPEGELCIDETGKADGRGAYVCPSVACLEAMVKKRRLDAAMKTKVSKQDYERLEEDFKRYVDGHDA